MCTDWKMTFAMFNVCMRGICAIKATSGLVRSTPAYRPRMLARSYLRARAYT